MVACYISPNVDDGEYSYFLNELDTVISELEHHRTVIAGDFNAKNKMWGARLTNSRGEKVARWAASKDLRLLNVGNNPTCVRHNGDSVVDLSCSTADIHYCISGWQVLDEFTYSDHLYIAFTINTGSIDRRDDSHENNDVYMYSEEDEDANMYSVSNTDIDIHAHIQRCKC